MKYGEMKQGIFLRRPNRFVAWVELDGREECCHVKNTGRCRELLIPGTEVWVEKSSNPDRKTKYSLIQIKKGSNLVNMDSQAPNQMAEEWLRSGALFSDLICLKREKTYGNSRFDLYIEADGQKAFMEVKGVTLEEDGIARFPDAPTERGVKHIEELIKCREEGYEAYLLFVIQMKNVHLFMPNDKTHPEFGAALRRATASGVHVLAYDCVVKEGEVFIDQQIGIQL